MVAPSEEQDVREQDEWQRGQRHQGASAMAELEMSATADLNLMRGCTAGAASRRAACRVDRPMALVLVGLGAVTAVAVVADGVGLSVRYN
eukprot:scaffold18369_cov111-Isochrysis_galbana.AAC.5